MTAKKNIQKQFIYRSLTEIGGLVVTKQIKIQTVIYNIMIIGEAANMLTFEFREAHSDLQLRQITNMRNFLIHGYHNVEEDLVWEAIAIDLPSICEKIVYFLEEIESNNNV